MPDVTVTSDNSTADATATYTIEFTTATDLTVDDIPDRIVITFPGGFNANGAAVDGATITPSATLPTLEDATTTVVTLDVADNETAGDFTIVLSGIVNTQTAGTAYVVAVKTQDGDASYATLDGPTASAAFPIIAAAVATLTVEVQPSTAVAGVAIAPPVQVKAVDAFGNVIDGQSVAASLRVGTGALSGNVTRTTDASGIATFNDLKINLVGTNKVLRFTAAARTVDSETFNIYDVILTLNANGWTLISTDNHILSSGDNTSAFEGVTLKYKYVGTGFLSATIADLAPVEAIYVKTTGAGLVGLSYSTAGSPGASTKDLVAGWNLISSATETAASIVLSPLRFVTVGTQQGVGLATLVSQGSYNLTTGDWYIDATDWDLGDYTMDPFDGYWVYMNAAKSFGVIPD